MKVKDTTTKITIQALNPQQPDALETLGQVRSMVSATLNEVFDFAPKKKGKLNDFTCKLMGHTNGYQSFIADHKRYVEKTTKPLSLEPLRELKREFDIKLAKGRIDVLFPQNARQLKNHCQSIIELQENESFLFEQPCLATNRSEQSQHYDLTCGNCGLYSVKKDNSGCLILVFKPVDDSSLTMNVSKTGKVSIKAPDWVITFGQFWKKLHELAVDYHQDIFCELKDSNVNKRIELVYLNGAWDSHPQTDVDSWEENTETSTIECFRQIQIYPTFFGLSDPSVPFGKLKEFLNSREYSRENYSHMVVCKLGEKGYRG